MHLTGPESRQERENPLKALKKITIGINGFGRIGRTLYRLLEPVPHMDVVLVNDLADSRTLAHLLRYDSIHGPLPHPVSVTDRGFRMGNTETALTNFGEPGQIPWGEYGVCLLYTSPSPRDLSTSRMPSSA